MLCLSTTCFAENPFGELLHKIQGHTAVAPQQTSIPFLQDFLIVYQGDWIFIDQKGNFGSIDIMQNPCVRDANGTECCGRWKYRSLDSSELLMEGLFCLQSTYDIRIRDMERTSEIQCIGIRGARIENPIHDWPGSYAIDDPAIIDCGVFRLVRPE